MVLVKDRPVGVSIMSLMVALVGMLGLMLSLSFVLRVYVLESVEGLTGMSVGLCLFGFLYILLAYGLWTMRSWVRIFAIGLLVIMTTSGLFDTARNEILHLGTVVVFGLAFVTNLAVLLVLFRPVNIDRADV
ncbi:MAG: hypothetical protein ACI9H8_000825 [Lysobacterales bacterium]|jgi:hypothetical protein